MRVLTLVVALFLAAAPAFADKAGYLDIARRGWNYQLRTTMLGRDLSIPVHINGRDLSGAAICIVGDRPQPGTRAVLNSFRSLVRSVFGKPLPMRYAGPTARLCGLRRTVVLRLYSGAPPNRALSDDLNWMNEVLELGLPPRRRYAATSPALAQTFFGRNGPGTHIMVKQPDRAETEPLETDFYRSILLEELFQSFTFGMDVLHLDREAAFHSKLEEFPTNLTRIPWDSPMFMRVLLGANPPGLCEFDVMMLHAVARAPVEQTTEPAFIDYIDAQFDDLLGRARRTMDDPAFAPILDPACTPKRG